MLAHRRARNSYSRLAAGWLVALALGSAATGVAAPKVCGNDPGLGNFDPTSCPALLDDGVAPDERAGDGIYTVQVNLTAKPLLEYKVLPSGAFDGMQLGQTGICDLQGNNTNTFNNLQVPAPDTSRPVRFFYDSRAVSDPTYAAPPGNRSAGDDLMMRSPAARCPQWLVVGDFQNVPFDRTVGAVQLFLVRPGVFSGRLTAMKALAGGWHWKVAEQTAAGAPARLYGPSGWSVTPCDTDSVTVPSAVKAGDIVYFTWYSAGGRLQTTVLAPGSDTADGGVPGGIEQCPSPAAPGDLGPPTDLAVATPGDASTPGPETNPDGGGRPLPGIHCNCQLGASGARPAGTATHATLAAGALLALVRRRRRPAQLY